jgi:hypothetical protein
LKRNEKKLIDSWGVKIEKKLKRSILIIYDKTK